MTGDLAPLDDPAYDPVHKPIAGRVPGVVKLWMFRGGRCWLRRLVLLPSREDEALTTHVTVSDTIPDRDRRRGTARSWCLSCGWTHTLRWQGPTDPFEPNALAITQAHGTAHERAAA